MNRETEKTPRFRQPFLSPRLLALLPGCILKKTAELARAFEWIREEEEQAAALKGNCKRATAYGLSPKHDACQSQARHDLTASLKANNLCIATALQHGATLQKTGILAS
jgi:hypothetical protein